jgi:hypothetical protein
MTTPAERIRSLSAKGALPPEQAEDLLSALSPAGGNRGRSLLIDPLERVPAERLALVGLLAALAGIALERFGLRFDGFLDLHVSQTPWGTLPSLLDAACAWPLGSALFWLAARAAGRQGRFIDFLGLVGVARVPLVVFAIPIALLSALSPPLPALARGQLPPFSAVMVAHVILALFGIVWFVVILYRGFGTASGLRGPRRIATFVAASLLAEVAAKLVILRFA